jgi:hypothetical protein
MAQDVGATLRGCPHKQIIPAKIAEKSDFWATTQGRPYNKTPADNNHFLR